MKEGDLLDASAPYGRFTFRGVESDSVVFLAGGVGITPLMSSIRYLTDQSWNGRIDLVYACKDLESVIFRDELNQPRPPASEPACVHRAERRVIGGMDRPAWVHHRRTAGADSADPFAPHPLCAVRR